MSHIARMVHIRIDPDTLSKADERAAAAGVSRTEWFNRAIKWALEQKPRVTTKEELT